MTALDVLWNWQNFRTPKVTLSWNNEMINDRNPNLCGPAAENTRYTNKIIS